MSKLTSAVLVFAVIFWIGCYFLGKYQKRQIDGYFKCLDERRPNCS